MTTDLLRVEASERVDKSDFEFLADGAIQADHRQVIGYLFTDPTRDRGWILDGFAIDCPAGKQVRVTLGRAILGQRIGGEVKYGVLTSEGDATKIVDINAYAAGNYGIYVRFGLVAGDQQSRIFWNPSGAGAEYAQTIATRYQANWTLRVEAGSPGAEWLQIGTVAQATLAASANPPDTGITDQRAFYFEGSINSLAVAANFTWNGTTTIAATGADTTEMAVGDFIGFKTDGQLFEITAETPNVDLTIDNSSGLVIPAGAGADTSFVDTSSPAPYASGWSAEGGSGGTTANDRKNDRSAYGVADIQMFSAAVRQCIEDIKGRGLRRWWERDIGGMNIGFDAAPSEDVLAIGDANCGFEFNPTGAAAGNELPRINFDVGDILSFNRVTNQYEIDAGGILLKLDSSLADFYVPIKFDQTDNPQSLISALGFPLNGVTVFAKNTSGGALSQGTLVKVKNQAVSHLEILPTANATDIVMGTVYDVAGIANNASGRITIWGPGYLNIDYAAGVAGTRIGPSAVAGVGENVVADYYVAWLPYTQAAGAGARVVEGYIVGCQFI